MTIEEKLKELILRRYHSIREFTNALDMPYTTLDSIFRRGIGNSSVTNIIKICKKLNITVDGLAEGEIVPKKQIPTNYSNDRSEINDILEDAKEILINAEELTLDGQPVDKKSVESIIDAIDIGTELIKRKTK